MPKLEQLLAFVRSHDCSSQFTAWIDADAVHVPVDIRLADGRWFTELTPVRTVAEARDALGY